MLFTGRVYNMFDRHYDEIWICCRSLPKTLKQEFRPNGKNIKWVPELSPSRELFTWYLSKKDRGEWNLKAFKEEYTPVFMEEMSRPNAQLYLDILKTISKTKDVFVCCFCFDEHLCHRSLIKELIKNKETMDQNSFALLVAGSRSFDDYGLLENKLDLFLSNKTSKEITIIEGGARGADRLAKEYAINRGYKYIEFPADWNTYGRSAGYRRNEQMHNFLITFSDRGCVCFWDGESNGTRHNFELCNKFQTPLRIVRF